MDVNDNDINYNFYNDLLQNGLFTNIVPDNNKLFDLNAYKNTIQKPTDIKMFSSIEETIASLFFFINR